jgi:hypothetical protein
MVKEGFIGTVKIDQAEDKEPLRHVGERFSLSFIFLEGTFWLVQTHTTLAG